MDTQPETHGAETHGAETLVGPFDRSNANACARDSDLDWSARAYEPSEAERARLASTFGRLLRQARADAGLTQKQLAARSGIGQSSISMLESGHRRPRRCLVAALATAITYEDPDRSAGERLVAELVEACGDSLREDTVAAVAMRRRRKRRAGLRMYRLAQRATELDRAALDATMASCAAVVPELLAPRNATPAQIEREWQMLNRAHALLDESRRLREESVRVGAQLEALKPPRMRRASWGTSTCV